MLQKRTTLVLFIILLAVVAVISVYYLKQGVAMRKAAEIPAVVTTGITALPQASFIDASGKERTLAEFKGKTVLVNLWATWCPPCVAELPSLSMLQAKLDQKNFEVVAISLDRSNMKTVTDFLFERGADHLKAYQDNNREISMKWSYSGVPVSFLIGPDGNVIAQFDGPLEWHQGPVFDEISKALK